MKPKILDLCQSDRNQNLEIEGDCREPQKIQNLEYREILENFKKIKIQIFLKNLMKMVFIMNINKIIF